MAIVERAGWHLVRSNERDQVVFVGSVGRLVQKEVEHEPLARHNRVFVEIVDAKLVTQQVLVDTEVARERATLFAQNVVRCVGHDFHAPRLVAHLGAANQIDGVRGNGGTGPQSVDRHACALELRSHTQHTHAHAVFGDSVRCVALKPFWQHTEWRCQIENVGIGRFEQIGQRNSRA